MATVATKVTTRKKKLADKSDECGPKDPRSLVIPVSVNNQPNENAALQRARRKAKEMGAASCQAGGNCDTGNCKYFEDGFVYDNPAAKQDPNNPGKWASSGTTYGHCACE